MRGSFTTPAHVHGDRFSDAYVQCLREQVDSLVAERDRLREALEAQLNGAIPPIVRRKLAVTALAAQEEER